MMSISAKIQECWENLYWNLNTSSCVKNYELTIVISSGKKWIKEVVDIHFKNKIKPVLIWLSQL